MGSSSPGPNTTDVYLSVYLDRLLNGAAARNSPLVAWAVCRAGAGIGGRQLNFGDAALRDCTLHPSLWLAVDDLNYHWTGGAMQGNAPRC